MNQIFNLSRFIRYAVCRLSMQRKVLILSFTGVFISVFFISQFIIMNGINEDRLKVFYVFSMLIGGALFIGNSFHDFRKKETALSYLMIPASAFEKYIFEYIAKIILFTLFYPILFYLAANFANSFVGFIKPSQPPCPFGFSHIFEKSDHDLYRFVCWIYILGSSLIYAGTTAIKKYPLLKTALFVGTIFLIVMGYVYILFEKLKLYQGIRYFLEKMFPAPDRMIPFLHVFFIGTAMIALLYGFFKLKEKEV
jgi:hypothetical protein